MADPSKRWPENPAGKFFVDRDCAFCNTCLQMAPANFSASEMEDHAFVARQPANDAELANCRAALEQCPTGAIGDNG